MKALHLGFLVQKKLGMNRFGRPPRAAAVPNPKSFPGFEITSQTVSEQLVYRLEPESFSRTVIYLHGGGYVQPISKFHWLLLAEIGKQTDTAFVVPRYGLSPRYNVDAALELMAQVLEQTSDENLILAGDSAGGGLALALAQKPDWQKRLAGLLLISPWVDSAFDSPEIETYAARDPWLTPDALQYIANAWSAVGDFRRVEVSPLRGELAGIPKTLSFIGDHDLFYPDIVELQQKLGEAGVAAELEAMPGGLHVYPLLPVPEGQAARARIVRWMSEI